jgi:hypothetical protein
MRKLLKALAVVALLAAPTMAAVNVQVLVNGGTSATVPSGKTATITLQAEASTAGVGIASMAGDIVASGVAGSSASAWAFGINYNRVSPTYTEFVSVPGTAAAGGGWTGFGTMEANGTDFPNQTGAQFGNGAWATIATYTFTAGSTAGTVTLAFSTTGPSGGWVDGYLPEGTDGNTTIGTNTAATIYVPEPATLVLVAIGGLALARRRR